ncbi:PAAR domain-containing protein [Caballeronia sp. GAFFF1]|uniref:PAAR domain-containing protein n=1 Tax=Caballeronia sp. GAFFF1 TaxID=2921779 RepID=UPI00253F7052|nr:PAAR domain-containing protein [Caballeronia sp. GAFFF1]
MPKVVLLGHRHQCPEHGEGLVVTASTGLEINGRKAAGVGDLISCGAVIVSGSSSASFAHRSVARVGDTTSHGGVLVEGDDGFDLE